MAPRTISQIAGEFGLARGSAGDPFAQQETAVLGNISRSLEDIRSQQLEGAQARGFGRSSFTEGAFARQTADVVGQVGQQFAQARTQEALRETGFERDIISQELGADRQIRFLGEQTAAEQELIGSRAQAETGLIGARGVEQRATLADQLSGERELSALQAQQRLTEQAAGGALETQFIEARGAEQRAAIQEQTAAQEQLTRLGAQEERQTLEQRSQSALEQLNVSNIARQQLAETTGEQQRLTQAESFAQQGQILQQQAAVRTQEINLQFENDLAALDARFDRIRADLPFELEQKALYQKEILEKQLQVQREQKIVDTAIQTSLNYVLGNLSTEGGLGSGLAGILDDLAGDIL